MSDIFLHYLIKCKFNLNKQMMSFVHFLIYFRDQKFFNDAILLY